MTSREVGTAMIIRGSEGSPRPPDARPARPRHSLVGPGAYLNRAGYASVPEDPDPSGTVIDQDDLPRVGVWVMPDNILPGMLEDYLCFLVPEGDALFDRARRCVDEIPGEERRFAQIHAVKALIHTWLAWQDDPGTPLGQAITKRYFESEGPHVRQLLDWLTRLFA